ncbi:E3 ubiquitin-protein ligase TRIM21-like [Notolabrus celidotus]|uniref:E3 ubiquitin-protein ligase TRIM21-like n=1 Tax=Notolabrus celidotus TaxID=1203425 RepID=UPI00149058F9|nr:E3 ubiquitin-protein ligase TRIM21-like [Notolabrus celidotus]
MSATSCLLTEDQFLCAICLDVFTDPVAIPCGHNFCKKCITEHWDINDSCQCPVCKKVFSTRPELHINTFISVMAAQFKQSAQQKASSISSSEEPVSKPGEVPCDVCTGTRAKALKSCLVCLTSYCETHLEPHLTAPSLKRHQLVDPVENLEGRMCTKHNKLLELFCKTDHMFVCMLCTVLDHKVHIVVPLEEEYEAKKAELGRTEAGIQQKIQQKQQKIQEFNRSVELSDENADGMIAQGVQIFTALKESGERAQAEFTDSIKEKQRKTGEQAEGFVKELEQEISELKKKSAEVEQISHSEDHLQLLKSFQILSPAPDFKDWTNVGIIPPSYEANVDDAKEALIEQVKKLFAEVKMKKIQQYAVDVTLDPDTANPKLIVSDDGKQVQHCNMKQNLPDTPGRFDYCVNVLARQGFSSGKFYFEVQVKGKIKWTIGVVRESISRKGHVQLSAENGCWTIGMKNENEYKALNGTDVSLTLKSQPEKIGVFVDFEGRRVSFYDVDTAGHICSFTGVSSAGKIFPFFNPGPNLGGKNSAPLIISPVNQTE